MQCQLWLTPYFFLAFIHYLSFSLSFSLRMGGADNRHWMHAACAASRPGRGARPGAAATRAAVQPAMAHPPRPPPPPRSPAANYCSRHCPPAFLGSRLLLLPRTTRDPSMPRQRNKGGREGREGASEQEQSMGRSGRAVPWQQPAAGRPGGQGAVLCVFPSFFFSHLFFFFFGRLAIQTHAVGCGCSENSLLTAQMHGHGGGNAVRAYGQRVARVMHADKRRQRHEYAR